MQNTFEVPGVAVIDNFLLETDFEDLRILHASQGGERVPLRAPPGSDNVTALRGISWHVMQSSTGDWSIEAPHKSLETFVWSIIDISLKYSHVIGELGKDWTQFSITPWTFFPGTTFEAHVDGPSTFTGGFIFFAVSQWLVHYGGLLVILDAEQITEDSTFSTLERLRRWGTEDEEPSFKLRHGVNYAIHPLPNRLVFLAPNVVHMVTRVEGSSRQVKRQTFVGFFS
jgi:hypothetical protein